MDTIIRVGPWLNVHRIEEQNDPARDSDVGYFDKGRKCAPFSLEVGEGDLLENSTDYSGGFKSWGGALNKSRHRAG